MGGGDILPPPPQPSHRSQLPSPCEKSLPSFKVDSNASSPRKSHFSTLPYNLPSQHQVLGNIYVDVLSRLRASDAVDPSSLFSRTPRPGLQELAGLQRLAEGSWGSSSSRILWGCLVGAWGLAMIFEKVWTREGCCTVRTNLGTHDTRAQNTGLHRRKADLSLVSSSC